MNPRLVLRHALTVVLLCAAAIPAAAQLLGTPAHQVPSGSLKVLAFAQTTIDQELTFGISRGATCSSANGVTFGCSGAGDVEAKRSGNGAIVKVLGQIGDYVQPYALFGAGDYSLSVPSTTVTNKLSGSRTGLLYGGGVKFSVVPETLVDAAVALDLGVSRATQDLDRLDQNGAATPVDETLSVMTYQVAVEASRRFNVGKTKVEPYGGVKWVRVDANLKDNAGGGTVSGTRDVASPFLGLRWPGGDKLDAFVEAAFVDGTSFGGGLEWRFR